MNTSDRVDASRRTSPSAGSRGFTLLELLMTAIVLGTSLVAASWSMSAVARTKVLHEANDDPALALAREVHELALGLAREPAGLTGASTAAQVTALDALVGAHFSPPILADGTTATGYDGWSQHVSLAVHALSDLSRTGDDPADGLPSDGDRIYRLVVEVRHDGQPVSTSSWWLSP